MLDDDFNDFEYLHSVLNTYKYFIKGMSLMLFINGAFRFKGRQNTIGHISNCNTKQVRQFVLLLNYINYDKTRVGYDRILTPETWERYRNDMGRIKIFNSIDEKSNTIEYDSTIVNFISEIPNGRLCVEYRSGLGHIPNHYHDRYDSTMHIIGVSNVNDLLI